MEKDLRMQPFSDSVLRDMAISFPRSKVLSISDCFDRKY